jgi:putative transposase
VRIQAESSPQWGPFALSPADRQHLPTPAGIDGSQGQPTLMLCSVVDDRSGVAYQEYHCAYGDALPSTWYSMPAMNVRQWML